MRTWKNILIAGALTAMGGFAILPAAAQVDVEPGVARVSFIRGDVSTQRGDSGESSAATLNTPLVAGDKIYTGERSRAEVQLDFANVLRLEEGAEANIATLTRNRIQVQVAEGLATYSVWDGSDTDVEIDTPNVVVRPLGNGQYRIQVNGNGDTFVTVREGRAEISTPQGSTTVDKNEMITVRG